MLERQSERMEQDLAALRDLFDDARINEDPTRMIQISKVLVATEKEIHKQRVQEGLLVDRTEISRIIDQLSEAAELVARELLPRDLHHQYTDRLREQLRAIWDGCSVSTDATQRAGAASGTNQGHLGNGKPRDRGEDAKRDLP